MLFLEYSVDALNVKWKIISFKKENNDKKKERSFCKRFVKVKLVLVNIRFKLDISISVMAINPGIGFGAWQQPPPPWLHHHQSSHHHHTITAPPPNQPSHNPPDLHCLIKTHEPCRSPLSIKTHKQRQSKFMNHSDLHCSTISTHLINHHTKPRPTPLGPHCRTTITTHSVGPITTPKKMNHC